MLMQTFRVNQLDLLLARADRLDAGRARALVPVVAGARSACVLERHGWTALLLGVSGEIACEAAELIEGGYPEIPGMRIRSEDENLRIDLDWLNARPLFTNSDQTVFATRPGYVAALNGLSLDEAGLSERLLLGFHVSDSTIFAGVHRIGDGFSRSEIEADREGIRLISSSIDDPVGDGNLQDVAQIVASAFESGAALELTGGCDSRLLLALGLSAGCRPKLAFTIDTQGSEEDAAIAGELCTRIGAEHLRIPVDTETGRDANAMVLDGRRFVGAAGSLVQATSYAWLPSVYRVLSPRRDAQVTGAGGEVATGFYDTPLDALCSIPIARRLWLKRRLMRPGVSDVWLGGAGRSMRARCVDRCDALLIDDGPWQDRTRGFYLRQRLRSWAAPVLVGSGGWYRPVAPLLSRAYMQWAWSQPVSARRGRDAQRSAIARLAPDLADIRFAGSGDQPAWLRQSRKIASRLRGAASTPDLFSERTCRELLEDPETESALEQLSDAWPFGRAALSDGLRDRRGSSHEVGVVVSTAWALSEATTVQQALQRPIGAKTA